MRKQMKISMTLLTLLLFLPISVFATPSVTTSPVPPHTLTGSASISAIDINNSIIKIDNFGETYSGYWYYPINGNNHLWWEEPLMCYGAESPVWLSKGNVTQGYTTSTGSPDTWYDAVIKLKLDSDNTDDINVKRSIMVPSGQNYFFVRYKIENINGSNLDNFRIFQGVDYDVNTTFDNDEGGYDADDDFVWANDTGSCDTYVGFTSYSASAHHSVDNYSVMWVELETGSLNDTNYYSGNVGVGLEWDFGTLEDGQRIELIVKFAFADNYSELGNMLAPPSVESSNLSGDTQDIFQPGESVFAKGSGYIPNTRYDLYVVNDTTWINDRSIPSRVSGTTDYVITDSNGNINCSDLFSSCGPPALIWKSSSVGQYDIVVDVNHNQNYDKGTDVLDDMDVDDAAGFETVPEFSTIAIPVASILGLLFFFNYRKRRKG